MADGGGRLWARGRRSDRSERPKRHENMRSRMEAGVGRGNDWWSELATVSGAVPRSPTLSRRAIPGDGRSRACPSVRLPVTMVAAVDLCFRRGLNLGGPSAGQGVMKTCASQWKEAKAAGTIGGESWPQFLAQCRANRSAAVSSSGCFAPAPAAAPAPAPQSGSLFPWWQPSSPASTPASNINAPSALRADQYTTELQARARCPSDTVV
jgi:hypothetical protein